LRHGAPDLPQRVELRLHVRPLDVAEWVVFTSQLESTDTSKSNFASASAGECTSVFGHKPRSFPRAD
jgi:hypothetical protein